ncbi:hypothetical protein ES703_105265 [subsurface metagenome]
MSSQGESDSARSRTRSVSSNIDIELEMRKVENGPFRRQKSIYTTIGTLYKKYAADLQYQLIAS